MFWPFFPLVKLNYLFPVMKVGHPVNISTTEMLLAPGRQTVCWKDRKQKLVPKMKTKCGEGIITSGWIDSWVTDSLKSYLINE